MISDNLSHSARGSALIREKAMAFVKLLKLRLSLLVALSAVFGYAMASPAPFSILHLVMVGLGGLLVTGSSNVLNQIFEREYDGLMKRTNQRPLPTKKLSVGEALIYSIVLGIVGVGILGYFFNLPTALLGIIGLLSYAFVYTPMKRISPFSVFVGAIPGALPPLIGWVAWTGSITSGGLILFAFQFFWQFPHFWAIAWILNDDYQKAGFKMLPSASGQSKFSAVLILIYTFSLIPLVLFPIYDGMIHTEAGIALACLGLAFCWPAFQLFRSLDMKAAKRLMFASFIYLPLIQIAFLLGKV